MKYPAKWYFLDLNIKWAVSRVKNFFFSSGKFIWKVYGCYANLIAIIVVVIAVCNNFPSTQCTVKMFNELLKMTISLSVGLSAVYMASISVFNNNKTVVSKVQTLRVGAYIFFSLGISSIFFCITVFGLDEQEIGEYIQCSSRVIMFYVIAMVISTFEYFRECIDILLNEKQD